MSKIQGKNTKPEMLVRKYLHSQGFRYSLHKKSLPGKPDLVLRKYSTVILIHGCFWHGHEGCEYFKIPKTRTQWWKNKIQGNKERDTKNLRRLREKGWKVIVVWECGLKKGKFENTLTRIHTLLKRSEEGNIC